MIALIICVIGLVIYLATEGKPSEAGRIAYWTGLAFTLWFYGGRGLF
jgi:hypothetical protein